MRYQNPQTPSISTPLFYLSDPRTARGIRKVRISFAKLSLNISRLKFRTKIAKSGALETTGLRETKMAFLALPAVMGFVRRSPRFFGFSAVPNGRGGSWDGRDWRMGQVFLRKFPLVCNRYPNIRNRCTWESIFDRVDGIVLVNHPCNILQCP